MKKIGLLFFNFMFLHYLGAQVIQTSESPSSFETVNKELLSIFFQYPIVAIGEGQHNSALTFEWLNTFINEREFPGIVRNIVVEFGASEYQSVMDDYVVGKDVPDDLFKKCWRETTQIMVWDNPIYEAFFRSVRQRNLGLPKEKQIRILLGDPSFGSKESRDEHAFSIIQKEVLDKNQTALLIYGDMHFVRRDIFFNYCSAAELEKQDINLVQWLDLNHPGKTFSIWGSINTNDSTTNEIIQKENIRIPSLLLVSNTQLGTLDFTPFYPYPTERIDKEGNTIDPSTYIEMPMKNIVDAILFRGNWQDQNREAPRPDEIYADTVYLNEIIRRAKVMNAFYYMPRLEYYKLRWSAHYDPFITALESMDTSRINKAFEATKHTFRDFQWMPVLNYWGYTLLRRQDVQKAIATFELATREFPNESNAYDSLGDGYLASGNTEKAIKSFSKAVQLNPDNTISKMKLEELLKK